MAFATQGTAGDDESRLRVLLSSFGAQFIPFHRRTFSEKLKSFLRVLRQTSSESPDLIVMEGTGFAGGLAVLILRFFRGIPYLVSSGDAVGPFVFKTKGRWGILTGVFSQIYEKMLCRVAMGFMGWTPYLTGRALTFGTRKAISVPSWPPFQRTEAELDEARKRIRMKLGIPFDAIVLGVCGSLAWNNRVGFCYGAELVRVAKKVTNKKIFFLIVGGGEGLAHLKRMVPETHRNQFIFTDQISREDVPNYLAAMDVGSLPQTLDQVGSFRYTTKLCEYLMARLPVVTTQVPFAYDLDEGWAWRIPGYTPWADDYLDAFAKWINDLDSQKILEKKKKVSLPSEFNREKQIKKVTAFIQELFDQRV